MKSTILWAFRFEEEEGVRAEACHAVVAMRLEGEEITEILQDRYLVETSSIVLRYCRYLLLNLLDHYLISKLFCKTVNSNKIFNVLHDFQFKCQMFRLLCRARYFGLVLLAIAMLYSFRSQ